MKHYLRTLGLAAVASVALAANTTSAEGPAIKWELDDALKQVDRQADDFQSAMARVEVVRRDLGGTELSREKGTIFMDRKGKIRLDTDAPSPRTYLVEKSTLYIHHPDEKRVEIYSLSRHKDRIEPFMRLGFTDSGKDLKDDYLLTSLGERDVGDSRTLGLELTPESEKARAVMGKAQLWIDQSSWTPSQQVFTASSRGEEITLTFTHVARNLQLNPDLFSTKWPRGTDKQKIK
ncbi:outer membrane lipoprotein carrier protein LolA [Pseudohalioglobus sediminis]|uniref:Outer membrane lipoprotein carrier protein LolA n=1 Tax=Pseudohalioglobus sediminis TaxID=2606449 RepID=A0A5B0X6Z7_9GAMM|nr:outer membrane lipoprotein carrier protein LolA [Pseudohalioglobus sediminis]KAA1194358.1 outer membrane lipoprotein carrier protein LolA [Pseudohalioglobus sediminis]